MEKTISPIGFSTDEEIIRKVLQGETALFELLIRRYNPVLYKIARGYGFRHQDAEDLLQEVHFKAYTELNRLENRLSYKGWLSRIMINKCLYKLSYGFCKYEKADSRLIGEQVTPLHALQQPAEHRALNKELAALLENSIQQLPVNYRMVFIFREVEGFNTAETADLLAITEENVKVRLNRAKALLRKRLEQSCHFRELFDFHLVYCDQVVRGVFDRIRQYHSR